MAEVFIVAESPEVNKLHKLSAEKLDTKSDLHGRMP